MSEEAFCSRSVLTSVADSTPTNLPEMSGTVKTATPSMAQTTNPLARLTTRPLPTKRMAVAGGEELHFSIALSKTTTEMNELRRQRRSGRIEGMRDAFEPFDQRQVERHVFPQAEGIDDRRLRQRTIGDGPSSTPTTQEGVVDIDLRIAQPIVPQSIYHAVHWRNSSKQLPQHEVALPYCDRSRPPVRRCADSLKLCCGSGAIMLPEAKWSWFAAHNVSAGLVESGGCAE